MILTLLWLTVSAPFVLSCRQTMGSDYSSSSTLPGSDNEEESTNPFGNNTEEKVPNAGTFSEEYLHHTEQDAHTFMLRSAFGNTENARLYVAFHGELLVPPPNFS